MRGTNTAALSVLWGFLFGTCLVFGGEALGKTFPKEPADAQAEAILAAPTWNYSRFEAGADQLLLGVLFKQLGALKTEEVRAVVARLMAIPEEDPRFRDSRFKTYVINRLIFEISPNTSWREVPRVLGGIGFPPEVEAAVWPLLFASDGTLRIASRSAGYAGPPYEGLAEFDAFARVFSRRDLTQLRLEPPGEAQ